MVDIRNKRDIIQLFHPVRQREEPYCFTIEEPILNMNTKSLPSTPKIPQSFQQKNSEHESKQSEEYGSDIINKYMHDLFQCTPKSATQMVSSTGFNLIKVLKTVSREQLLQSGVKPDFCKDIHKSIARLSSPSAKSRCWDSQESLEMDHFIKRNEIKIEAEINIKCHGRRQRLYNGSYNKDRWKFNRKYLLEVVNILSAKVGVDVTPTIDVFAVEANRQCDVYISEKQDFFSESFLHGAFGKSWKEWITWTNAPYDGRLYKAVKVMEQRGCKGIVIGPIDRKWRDWYDKCKKHSKNMYHKFQSKHNKLYKDMFLHEFTGYKSGMNPPKWDIIAFWLDFST